MNWTILASVAETVGALGVVLSLLYLARQIRDGSLESQRSRYGELTNQVINVGNTWIGSDTLSDIMFRGLRDPSALDPPEAFRFYSSIFGVMKAWEASYHYSLERGVHDWGAEGLQEVFASYMAFPGMQRYFEARHSWFSSGFQAEVTRVIAAEARRVDDDYETPLTSPGGAV